MSEYTQEEVVEALLEICSTTGVTNLAGVVESEDGSSLLVQFKVTLHENPGAAAEALEITPDHDEVPDGQIH
jgi:hypothetical protein